MNINIKKNTNTSIKKKIVKERIQMNHKLILINFKLILLIVKKKMFFLCLFDIKLIKKYKRKFN